MELPPSHCGPGYHTYVQHIARDCNWTRRWLYGFSDRIRIRVGRQDDRDETYEKANHLGVFTRECCWRVGMHAHGIVQTMEGWSVCQRWSVSRQLWLIWQILVRMGVHNTNSTMIRHFSFKTCNSHTVQHLTSRYDTVFISYTYFLFSQTGPPSRKTIESLRTGAGQ